MAETLTSQETWVGRPLERFEDDALLRGAGRFLDDLDPAPGAHHAAVLRSPHAHARIARVDAAAALRIPGVTGALTGAEVVASSRPFPAAAPTEIPCYAAAGEVARYVGEPLAVLVVRETFAFPRWTCAPMECAGVVARWEHGDDSLTAWTNFQGPFTLHTVAAAALGLTGARLRLITPPDSGGSFGVKAAVYAAVVLMGLASRKLGVPVRWIEDRRESLAAGGASTQRTTDVEAAFTEDGELIGLRLDVVEDVGAYVRAPEPATLYRMHGALSGAYRVRNVAVRNRVVLTNRAPTTLNRGFGGPQLYLALEGAMDVAARRLGLDPAELRRRNLVASDDFPYTTPSGGLYASGDY